MLIVTRSVGEVIEIDDGQARIRLVILAPDRRQPHQARIGIEAPPDVPISRPERPRMPPRATHDAGMREKGR